MSTAESQGGCEAAREAWSLCLRPSGEAEAEQEKESQTVWPVQGTDGEGKEGICTRNKTTSQKEKINPIFFFLTMLIHFVVHNSMNYIMLTSHTASSAPTSLGTKVPGLSTQWFTPVGG